jgi:hypothetical protein
MSMPSDRSPLAAQPPAAAAPLAATVQQPPVATVPRPGTPIALPRGLDAATPVLFLPVNIETRFMDSGDRPELLVRIYPDQIAINSQEPELTAQEIVDGQTYWDTVWRAGTPPPSLDTVKAPWRGLASLYGAQRAAWIALQMQPTNLPQQPAAPTPDGSDPAPAPAYPQFSTPPPSGSWTKPAIASALPDAWTVVTVLGTQTATFKGSAITPDLAIGLNPGGAQFAPGSPVDPGMTWLVDFDAALAAGMALKIPLNADQHRSGFDRIFVYGLRTSGAGADDFASLLDAHHYTDGFSLVPQGAPTNNTPDASSAYSRKDPDYEFSFAVEREGPLTTDADGDGNAFANAIGIDPTHMDHVGYADGDGVRNATDMLTALWPATLGYFFKQMMADVFTPAQIEDIRDYVLANAVPRGPIPAFRVGRTPYGVVPVTSLSRYRPVPEIARGSIEPSVVNFVRALWPNWLASSGAAPHMENTGDPDQELVSVLGMDASSMTFRGRKVFGDDFLWNYMFFIDIPFVSINLWWTSHLARGRQLLDSFGLNSWDPRVIHLGMAGDSYPVWFSTVQSGPLSETDTLNADAALSGGTKGNYIQWLRQASIGDIQAENYPGPKPSSLLYKILRQSVILEHARLATSAEVNAGRLQLSQVREAELIAIQPPPALPPVSVWEVLARPSIPNPQLSWADYLVLLNPLPSSPFARLAELRASLDRLALLPTAELDRLLTESLDACSHRLDVWVAAVANAMLKRARANKVAGVHLGAFGWVEEVRPAAQRAAIQGADLQRVQALDTSRAQTLKISAALPVPVEPLTDNGGFIYAPSLAQASAAAVLRNGYMTHKGTTDEGVLSIDLSSERVRKALTLLDGVSEGQSLSALLGYIFEGAMHDQQLDQYIQPFRDRFPIRANKLTPSNEAAESVAATDVVDGVALSTAWQAGNLAAGGTWGTGLPGPGADQNATITLLQTIDDYADALSDLSISEAVFQIIRGNFGRAGGLMNAVSRGERPPHPDIVDTPRGGLDLTHRVLLLFAGTPAPSAAWSGLTQRPRAQAEPWLDAWLGALLPDPTLVRCEVSYSDAGGDHVAAIRLADLDLGPLDCLAMADAAEVPQQSELESRIRIAALLPTDATNIQIDFQPASPPAGSFSFPDAFFLVKTLRNAIGSSRALTPQDLTVPEKKATDLGGAVDLADVAARAAAAVQNLTADLAALNTAAAGLPGAPGPVRDTLLRCSFYGVPGSLPAVGAGTDAGLADQATAVAKTLQDRLTQASAVDLATAQLADAVGVFTTIFGDLVVLPRFTPPDAASLQGAFAQSATLVASDTQAPARWLMQLTHIRPALSRLDAAMSLAQVLGGAAAPSSDLLLGQLPLAANDTWLGLGIDPANPPDKGRIALACLTQGDPLTQTPYAGLLIDEWPERIPSTQENAAVAFHYEEPKARAPQALLLGVCPDTRATWDDDLVLGILEETLELAKIRTVDLDSVQQVGQILPALYFPFNLKSATISMNLVAKEMIRAL